MKKFFIFGFVLLLILGSSSTGSAHSPYNNKHSVDSGEIRWGTYHGSTKWTTARNHAISKWDAVGVINIAGDTTSTVEDLSFVDYKANDGALGYWEQYAVADVIAFNDYYFNSMESCERNKTALHELGHALNLNDDNITPGTIMKQGKICQNDLSSHDINDIKARW